MSDMIVCTTEANWLATRQTGIGASDALFGDIAARRGHEQ